MVHAQQIRAFTDHEGRGLESLRVFYANLPFSKAVAYAAAAIQPNGRMNLFQRSLGVRRLRRASKEAIDKTAAFQSARTFDELLAITHQLQNSIKGLGTLWAYDAALRIGFHFGPDRLPTEVHLNRRSKKGLQELFGPVPVSARTLAVAQFPRKMQQLKPYEIEYLLRFAVLPVR